MKKPTICEFQAEDMVSGEKTKTVVLSDMPFITTFPPLEDFVKAEILKIAPIRPEMIDEAALRALSFLARENLKNKNKEISPGITKSDSCMVTMPEAGMFWSCRWGSNYSPNLGDKDGFLMCSWIQRYEAVRESPSQVLRRLHAWKIGDALRLDPNLLLTILDEGKPDGDKFITQDREVPEETLVQIELTVGGIFEVQSGWRHMSGCSFMIREKKKK